MPKGMSLHIGLNAVDPVHYQGWAGVLNACEADARSMEEIARKQGFITSLLKTSAATRDNVVKEISAAANGLVAGDIFLLTYSGHGGQLPDLSGDESDRLDETWCLFDGQLVDDETYYLLSQFAEGARIFVLSDSCHSGTVTKAVFFSPQNDIAAPPPSRIRAMPRSVALQVYETHRPFYDRILKEPALIGALDNIRASTILISGCQDNQTSIDGPFNGVFTANLLAVWGNSDFDGDYRCFCSEISKHMPARQTPNYYVIGPNASVFEKQRPFTI